MTEQHNTNETIDINIDTNNNNDQLATLETKDSEQQTKVKARKQRNPLNCSAFRSFALDGGYVQMVAPKAIDAMQLYLDKFLLRPIIKDITVYIGDKMAETSSKKAFRIVQLEKLRSIIQKYVGHDTTKSILTDDHSLLPRKNEKSKEAEFAFHQLTFRKHINNLTEQISSRTNIQWSGKCMDMLQSAIEHELYLVMNTCGRILRTNAGEPSKKKLKLTHKDVRFVFEAHYSKH